MWVGGWAGERVGWEVSWCSWIYIHEICSPYINLKIKKGRIPRPASHLSFSLFYCILEITIFCHSMKESCLTIISAFYLKIKCKSQGSIENLAVKRHTDDQPGPNNGSDRSSGALQITNTHSHTNLMQEHTDAQQRHNGTHNPDHSLWCGPQRSPPPHLLLYATKQKGISSVCYRVMAVPLPNSETEATLVCAEDMSSGST